MSIRHAVTATSCGAQVFHEAHRGGKRQQVRRGHHHLLGKRARAMLAQDLVAGAQRNPARAGSTHRRASKSRGRCPRGRRRSCPRLQGPARPQHQPPRHRGAADVRERDLEPRPAAAHPDVEELIRSAAARISTRTSPGPGVGAGRSPEPTRPARRAVRSRWLS